MTPETFPPKTFSRNNGSVKNVSDENKSYRHQRWLVAHNGWNTEQRINPNQRWSITQMLDYGVRGFALDIEGDDQQDLELKHDILVDSVKGWLGIRDELKTWMEKPENGREIVTLFFESRVSGPERGKQTSPLHALDESLKAISCYRSGRQVQEDAIRYRKLKEMIDGDADHPSHRLFVFIEKEPDEGWQRVFPVMRKSFSENIYGNPSLKEKTWTDLRDGSSISELSPMFMNHFGLVPDGDEFDRNTTRLIVKHSIAFAFAFSGCFPAFISLDYINWKPGDVGPMDAIGALQAARTLSVSPFQFRKVNDFDSVHVAFDVDADYNIKDTRITGFDVDIDDKGITDIKPIWGDKNSVGVSGVQLVSVGKRGLVNMRYKTGTNGWPEKWLTKYEKFGDSNNNKEATYEFYQSVIVGVCVRQQQGYGATDFATAAIRWPDENV